MTMKHDGDVTDNGTKIFVMDGKIKINKLISNFNDENSFNFKIINFYIYKLGQE